MHFCLPCWKIIAQKPEKYPLKYEFTQIFIDRSVRLHCTWPQACFLGKHPLEKKHFSKCISHLGGNFSGFWANFSSTVVRIELVSRFLPDLCQFLSDFTQNFIAWSVRLHSTCPNHCFDGMHLLWKKNSFQIDFHNLGGNFSSFGHKFSSTVVKTSLDSRFFIRIYAFLRTLRRILLAGLSALHSTCPQDCFHGKHLLWKKKQFSNKISHYGRRLFGFSAKAFQHGSQNCIGFLVFNRIFANFIRSSPKNLLPGLSELHSTCP